LRPTKDWLSIPQPALTEFLPPDIRAMAIEWQNQPWSCKAEQAANPIPVPDRHIDSSYLLKGILVSSQGQMPMSGKTCGPKGKRKRYYAVTRSIRCPNSGEAVLKRMVPAASIEQLVLQVLQQVLLVAPNLKEILRKQVTRQFASDQLSQDGHADLRNAIGKSAISGLSSSTIWNRSARTRPKSDCSSWRRKLLKSNGKLEQANPLATGM
jgi:hypothetical protein